MTEERNDKKSKNNRLNTSLHTHLRTLMANRELNNFRQQLPAEFLSDASEGLGQVNDTKQLESVLQNLNQQMHHQLGHKKKRRKIKSIGDLSWSYWAIIFILLFAVAGYLIIRMLLHK
jgi:hypothetical protein